MFTEVAHAKLNLTLAVTGRRADGFHELLSLVTDLAWGDRLTLQPGGGWTLTCDQNDVPTDESNLVLKAAKVFQKAYPQVAEGKFHLEKTIPMGAGLGGGSTDAAAALRLLNQASGSPFNLTKLEQLAAEVGSDCPYFIRGGKQLMRGRGEILEPLPATAARALAGRRVFLIKPPFGVATPEAYAALAALKSYQSAATAEARLAAWLKKPEQDPSSLGNDLSLPVFRKYVALPTALEALQVKHGVTFRMTGSGSVCFALVDPEVKWEPVMATLRLLWGAEAWGRETQLLG